MAAKFCGHYKLAKSENFDEFMGALGKSFYSLFYLYLYYYTKTE